jgi:uracil phosphoribosyltransferase
MPVFVAKHPILQSKLTVLRKNTTDAKVFRDVLREITFYLGYEATRDIETREVKIDTPVKKGATGHKLKTRVSLIPVLRSGMGMIDPMTQLIPYAQVFHLGLYRHKHSLVPVLYYERFPRECAADVSIILEPMIATSKTLCATIDIVKQKYGCKKIKVISVVASAHGLKELEKAHPDVDIHCCAIDDELNEDGFVVPGLGDIGDRQFRTNVGKKNWDDEEELSSPSNKKQRTK